VRQRLQKILAAAGLASRRRAEAWLRDGRVSVNGVRAQLGDSADPERDAICVDGQPLRLEPFRYWLLHKPKGVLSSTRDPEGRRTVLALVPERDVRLYPVGRLDRDTEGLLLLTNDGETAQALLHPSFGSEREYDVTVRGEPSAETLRRLARGVRLDDGTTAPAEVGLPRSDRATSTSRFSLTLREGRKRQIRRSLEALGHPVVRLVRVRMGPLVLGDLAPGEARPLREAERRALAQHVADLRVAAAGAREGGTASRAGAQRSAAPGGRGAGRRAGAIDRARADRRDQREGEPEPEQEQERANRIRRHGRSACKPRARAAGAAQRAEIARLRLAMRRDLHILGACSRHSRMHPAFPGLPLGVGGRGGVRTVWYVARHPGARTRAFPPARRSQTRPQQGTPPAPAPHEGETMTRGVDVYEVGDEVVVEIEAPGIPVHALRVTLHGDRVCLAIDAAAGGAEALDERRWHRRERPTGGSERTIPLPRNVDPEAARARLADGLLVLRLPVRVEVASAGRRLSLVEDVAHAA
jgi:23S rRNA pseudouridine2605 synthase